MGKIKDLISRHKILSMICLLSLIIILMLSYVFFSIFIGGHDKYGDRLDGIDEVAISKSDMTKLEKTIKDDSTVKSTSVRLEGKIVYIDIEFTKDATKDKAKEIANKTLDEFSNKEKKFYDFEYILTQEGDDGFILTGTKGPKTDGISYIKS